MPLATLLPTSSWALKLRQGEGGEAEAGVKTHQDPTGLARAPPLHPALRRSTLIAASVSENL